MAKNIKKTKKHNLISKVVILNLKSHLLFFIFFEFLFNNKYFSDFAK